MTAFRDAVFISTLLICAAGAEQMINAKDFAEIFGAEPPRSAFVDDFLKGEMDCHEGKPHKTGMSDAYNRGYAARYELEQVQSAHSWRVAR